jgi:hypothetical protein
LRCANLGFPGQIILVINEELEGETELDMKVKLR